MSVVNVALPAIRTALGFAPLDLSWIVHVYALTFGGLLLLGGRACDLYGHRRLLVGGLVVFGLCSLAGGPAQAPWQLISARAGQGLGAAAAAPAALGMLTTFPEVPRRVRALRVRSAVNAAGGALGVLAGGLLTQYAGWPWVMLVNLSIVAAALGAWPGWPSSAPAAASSPTCPVPASSPAAASGWSWPRSQPPRPPASPPARPEWRPAFSTPPANSAAASTWPPWPPSPAQPPSTTAMPWALPSPPASSYSRQSWRSGCCPDARPPHA
ncbi:MFS transporter [Streptomyces sp. NBC_00893]|uniref:MFS transporter n=1 Tax=Streptomyces sp. NBC_00893 TaxID=2975862 RepID=UPI00338D4AC2